MQLDSEKLHWRLAAIGFGLGSLPALSVPVQAKDLWQAQARDQAVPSLASAAPAIAKGWGKLTSHDRLAPMLMLLGSGSNCVILTYDTNGNRLAQAVTTISTSGASWGASSFGCFIWK